MSLYQQILGDAYATLPVSVQRMHGVTDELTATGHCRVERGSGWFAALVATMMGFPKAGEDLVLRFIIQASAGRERWLRYFPDRLMRSDFHLCGGMLCEKLGPMLLQQRLDVRDGQVHLIPHRAWFLGFPVPQWLMPKVSAYAGEEMGDMGPRYFFDVSAALPLIGPIVYYRGWLEPTR